jgi:hypothetical protein
MARISASVAGADQNRKILSVIIAVIDLLRGDWKRAILSLLGYAGSSQLYLGQLLKVYLALFQTINPRIQRDIIFGTYSLGKSLLIGGLLAVFQVTAPASVRLPVIEMLEKLAERKEAIDGVLMEQGLAPRSDDLAVSFDEMLEKLAERKEAIDGVLMEQGLAPRSDDLAVSFEDIQRLQSLMDDTAFICSKEYEELTKHVESNFALRMVFQLVGIPTSDTFKKQRCGKGPRKPLVDNIVQESLDHPERKPQEQEQEEPEKIIPTTEATDEQVEAAIQKVDGPSEPGALPLQKPEESSSLPPTIQKPAVEKPKESSSLPPTISRRGGRRSLRRGGH